MLDKSQLTKNLINMYKKQCNIIYDRNRPLINSVLAGFFYFLFCWSLDFSEVAKKLFILLMLFLPGLTFPLTTCNYQANNSKYSEFNRILHLFLSVLIYILSISPVGVVLFLGNINYKYISVLSGLVGSLLFLLNTKYLLKKEISIPNIIFTALLSSTTFLPYEIFGQGGMLLGLSIFLWTIINGTTLNSEFKKARTANMGLAKVGH